jgi:ureidoacrylate peracid hydrolase
VTRLAAASDGHGGLTRNRQVNPQSTALLVIDVQHYCVYPGQGEWEHIEPKNVPADLVYYFDRIESTVLPNIARLQKICRKAGSEVMYTVIESLTSDGRERGLDYKISGFLVPKESPWAKVPEKVKPLSDEIIIPKGSSSVFNSTNIDYILRNLEVDYLVMSGLVTDQCVETAVRDACDRGFLVTLVTDACATYSHKRHEASLQAIKGYCRQVKTEELIAELEQLTDSPG